jgi:hypothetical protein
MIKFDVTRDELNLIVKVCARAEELMAELVSPQAGSHFDYRRSDMLMDLQATHANGCRLDFNALLGFRDADFAHDIFGIRRHINRETGQLEDCFVPRCARP